MERKKVTSKMIESVGYDAVSCTLELEFRPKKNQVSGAVYTYQPFTPANWEWFQLAKSIGRHFIENIQKDRSLTVKRVGEPVEKTVENVENLRAPS